MTPGEPIRPPAETGKAARATARLVTAPARGGIAVVVLSGPAVQEILDQVFRPRGRPPAEGRLALGWLVDGEELLDEVVVTLLDGGRCAEINIHGGPHLARRVLALLSASGAVVSEGGAIDPTLVRPHPRWHNPAVTREVLEALGQVTTPLAASAVSAQWAGGISALAADEAPEAAALRRAAGALPLMHRLLTPAEVVIAGPPNVGKSALTNALVGREVCIVSDAPGTTRDWVRTLAEVEGVPIWLTDTAGLWERPEGLDAEAVRRAWERIESADLVICVTAGGADRYGGLLARIRRAGNVLNVAGKADAVGPGGTGGLAVSAITGEGVPALRAAIRERLGFSGFKPAEPMAFTRRQAELLWRAADALDGGETAAARAALRELLAGEAGDLPA